MEIKAVIVDDEAPARRRVKMLLNKYTDIQVLAECSSGFHALEAINIHRPDVIFLDIQLGDMHGFDVLSGVVGTKPLIVFITAYDEFAIKAFDHLALDFILKPFSDSRFIESINRVKKQLSYANDDFNSKLKKLISLIEEKQEHRKKKYFHVRLNNKISIIKCADIWYVKAAGNYCEIFVSEKVHVIRKPITTIDHELGDEKFVRIHRSIIVNIDWIKEIFHNTHGDMEVKMEDGEILRVSRSYQNAFLKQIELR